MGLDVFFIDPNRQDTRFEDFCNPKVAEIGHEMNFPHVCGFHLFRDLDVTVGAPRNMFGFEPNGTLFNQVDLSYGWYQDLSPEELQEQLKVYQIWLDQRPLSHDRYDTEAISLLKMLKYAVQKGYGTEADY